MVIYLEENEKLKKKTTEINRHGSGTAKSG